MGVRTRYYPDDEDAIEMVLAFDARDGRDRPARATKCASRLRRDAHVRACVDGVGLSKRGARADATNQ